MRFASRLRLVGVSGFPEGFVGSWPPSCFFRRASIHGVWILFSVKARKTPSVCVRRVVEKGRLICCCCCCCSRRNQQELSRLAILTCRMRKSHCSSCPSYSCYQGRHGAPARGSSFSRVPLFPADINPLRHQPFIFLDQSCPFRQDTMPAHIDLGQLRLSYPSTGLDLALTSNAFLSTLSSLSAIENLPFASLESGRVWLSANTNVQLLLRITWPALSSSQETNLLKRRLLSALRDAAVSTTFENSIINLSNPASMQLITSIDIDLALEPASSAAVIDCRPFPLSRYDLRCCYLPAFPFFNFHEQKGSGSSS